jgi:hypothetical protein
MRLVVIFAMLTMGAIVSAQTKTDPKKADPKADDLATQIVEKLKQRFLKEDKNMDGYLDKDEMVNWFGLVKGPELLKKYDTDSDGKLSPDEFLVFAQTYADTYVKWMNDEEQKYQAKINGLQTQAGSGNKAALQQAKTEIRAMQEFQVQARNVDAIIRRLSAR